MEDIEKYYIPGNMYTSNLHPHRIFRKLINVQCRHKCVGILGICSGKKLTFVDGGKACVYTLNGDLRYVKNETSNERW